MRLYTHTDIFRRRDEEFRISDEQYPWENKTRTAFWRGALTGLGSYHQREHLQLAMMGHSDLETMDVAFNGLDGFMTRKTRRQGLNLVRPSVPMNDFHIYCAIIDIDGNSWSERFPRLLCMNSVVIKIAPAQIDYFWPSLIPGHHFLPATLMNLTAVVKDAVADEHQDVVSKVTANARSWCRANMVSSADDAIGFLSLGIDCFN
jgi:Glycosyl transferase family 90